MSQECEIFLKGDFCQMRELVKSTNRLYLDVESGNKKSKSTLFSETLKVPESKVLSFLLFSASRLGY